MADDLPNNSVDPNQEQNPEGPIMPSAQPQRAYEQHQEENKSSHIATILAIILLILIVVGGFYLLKFLKQRDTMEKAEPAPIVNQVIPPVEKPVTPPLEPQPKKTNGIQVKAPDKEPDTIVKEFYNWILSQPGDVIEDGRYKDRPEIYKTFIQKIENRKKDSLHPLLCSASNSAIADIQPPNTTVGISSIAVNLTENGKVVPLKVSLKLNGAWTITDILCLSEEGKRSVIENLKLETGLDYATLKNMSFLWSVPDYKGRVTKTISGKGFSTENTTVDPSVFENFFLKNGFKKDQYNEDGYQKDNMACVAHTEKSDTGRFDVEAVCGKI